MAPKIFITGVTGYIGGDALFALYEAHPEYEYSVLVRNSDKGAPVAAQYPKIRLVYGGLEDIEILEKEAAAADVVLHTADSSDNLPAAQAIATGLASNHTASSPAYWIHTSGTGILCWSDQAAKRYGEPPSQPAYDDLTGVHELTSLPDEAWHREIDKLVLSASSPAVKTAIVSPPMIYGAGRGPGNKKSKQLYLLASKTLELGQPLQLGRGLTQWNHVNVVDVSALFVKLVESAVGTKRDLDDELWGAKGYFLVESGVDTWGEMGRLVAEAAFSKGWIKNKEPKVVTGEEMMKVAGMGGLTFGLNSLGTAKRAKQFLGWSPMGRSLRDEVPDIVEGEAVALGIKIGYAEHAAGKK